MAYIKNTTPTLGIDGVINEDKKFTGKVTADSFETTAGECIVPAAITKIENDSDNRLLTSNGDGTATAEATLVFDGLTLSGTDLKFATLSGDAKNITNINGENITGKISGNNINLSSGLYVENDALQTRASGGISVTEDGLSLDLSPRGGLSLTGESLQVDVSTARGITEKGQNIQDADLLLLHDQSRGDTRSTTMKNFYEGYLRTKIPQAAGALGHVQFKGPRGLSATNKLTFNETRNILNVAGTTATAALSVSGTTTLEGAVVASIVTATSPTYAVDAQDYTILLDTTSNNIDVVLPSASKNEGRILNIKKTTAQNNITITTSEQNEEISTLQATEGLFSCSLQSDGKKWWLIA